MLGPSRLAPRAAHPSSYRPALVRTVGTALAAGLTTAAVDALVTLRHAARFDRSTVAFAAIALSLYGAAAILLGLVEGVVLGAIAAGLGPGWATALMARLRDDELLDRRVAAGVLSAAASATFYGIAVAATAFRLVALTERKLIGAVLTGAFAVALLPIAALLGAPFYRLLRRAVGWIPRSGRLSRTVLLAVMTSAIAVAGAGYYVVNRLDWRALHLGAPLAGALLIALQIAWAAAWTRLSRIVGRRGAQLAAATAILLCAAGFLAWRAPTPRTCALLLEESPGAGALARAAQTLSDRDHDGYGTLFGGDDCNDGDARIHPGARDLPDNGVDENCIGGDAHRAAKIEPSHRGGPRFPWSGNLLLIFVDTLRADRVGPSLTPRIDELARRGVRFRRAYAQAASTPRSVQALLTSRLPSQLRWDNLFQTYPRPLSENLTLFEVLHHNGYFTVGEGAHFYWDLDGTVQGFDEFDNAGALPLEDSNGDISSPRIAAKAAQKLAQLAAAPRKFALLVHLFDPHAHYLDHPELGARPPSLEGRYDREVAFTDRYVGEILDALHGSGLDDKTLVVLFSDHGEAFGTHRREGQPIYFHGQTVFDETLRVPLIVVAPGLTPRMVDDPVRLIDVAPTLLDAADLLLPDEMHGRSLGAALAGAPLAPGPVEAELLAMPVWNHAGKAILDADGRTKIIYEENPTRWGLYDLIDDPDEQHDLTDERPELFARMQAQMALFLDSLD